MDKSPTIIYYINAYMCLLYRFAIILDSVRVIMDFQDQPAKHVNILICNHVFHIGDWLKGRNLLLSFLARSVQFGSGSINFRI